METAPSFVCPCGAPAPATLPGPGGEPAYCAACGTPLVAPGPLPASVFERGLGAAMIVAVAGAALWALLCYFGKTGAPWSLAVGGLAVGVAARMAARARGGRVQLAAGVALFVFFALGEFLIYRHALLPRLEAMHRAEGALDADVLAEQELERIREEPERYASIEATRDLFLAMAAGFAAALWITRARPAVAAFRAPIASTVVEESAPVPVPDEEAPSETTTSSPEPPAPSGPASPGLEPASSPPTDGS